MLCDKHENDKTIPGYNIMKTYLHSRDVTSVFDVQ